MLYLCNSYDESEADKEEEEMEVSDGELEDEIADEETTHDSHDTTGINF